MIPGNLFYLTAAYLTALQGFARMFLSYDLPFHYFCVVLGSSRKAWSYGGIGTKP